MLSLAGYPNSGPALGALAFDPASRQLFVADRDTGMIHRFTLDGVDRGRFDHGTQALAALGLPPIAFDPRKRLNIESPGFDSGNPATWAYAPPARRVFGLAVNRGRLYYAVAAGLPIWSVAILPDGSFGRDARFEVAVPPGASPGAEISEILFDDNGDMLVAERDEPTGAYDYKALAASGENRVLRFRPKRPDDPPSRDLWFPVPKEYAIGFPSDYHNDNGGIAIGYGYDAAGNINRAVCGGTLWSTGEQLRNAQEPAIIRRLQPGGPLIVDGLQGNSVQLLRPQNEPPFATYFIDYDDRFDDPQTRGTSRRCRDLARVRTNDAADIAGSDRMPGRPVQCRRHVPVRGGLSVRHRILERLLCPSRLPAQLCTHPRQMCAPADELRSHRGFAARARTL